MKYVLALLCALTLISALDPVIGNAGCGHRGRGLRRDRGSCVTRERTVIRTRVQSCSTCQPAQAEKTGSPKK